MITKEQKENCGQLPEFISEENRGYFFDIVWEVAMYRPTQKF